MEPSINVNLAPCLCANSSDSRHHDTEVDPCAARAVIIPCPIPRSVTFGVTLGKCNCDGPDETHCGLLTKRLHALTCPARPSHVSCSIFGKTWEESEVVDCDERDGVSVDGGPQDGQRHAALLRICRERWALVKALLLGRTYGETFHASIAPSDLFTQRDAVFAALGEVARYHVARNKAANRITRLLDGFDSYSESLDAAYEPALLLQKIVRKLSEQLGGTINDGT